MTKLHHALIPLVALLSVAPASAAPRKVPAKTVEKITCKEFVALDDEFKPKAVSYALGYDRAKHPEAEVIDITGVDRIVPVIITSCKARPTETLLQRIRADLHKL